MECVRNRVWLRSGVHGGVHGLELVWVSHHTFTLRDMSRPSSAGGAAGGLGAVKVGGSKHGGSGGTTASAAAAAAAAAGVSGSVSGSGSVTAAAIALPIATLPGQSAELTALFECPVCFDYVLPPILQCQAGHLVCNQCRQKLSCCPTCRGPLTPSIRNLAMEKVASTLPFPCKVRNHRVKILNSKQKVAVNVCKQDARYLQRCFSQLYVINNVACFLTVGFTLRGHKMLNETMYSIRPYSNIQLCMRIVS